MFARTAGDYDEVVMEVVICASEEASGSFELSARVDASGGSTPSAGIDPETLTFEEVPGGELNSVIAISFSYFVFDFLKIFFVSFSSARKKTRILILTYTDYKGLKWIIIDDNR